MNHDPKTPVSMLGLSPAEAKKERQRRSYAALKRIVEQQEEAAQQPRSPTLEERVESLERAVLIIMNQLNSGN